MRTVMLLSGGLLLASQSVDGQGYVLRHKLIYGLDDGDLPSLQAALTLTDALRVCALGAALPEEALRFALAYGAQEALYVGAEDWPEQPDIAAVALALSSALDGGCEVLITSDQGEQALVAAQSAANHGLPCFNSLLSVERQGDRLRLLRKLEKGGRQVILAKPPLALAVLPWPVYAAPPDLDAQIQTQERPIIHKRVSYYDCLRRFPGRETPYWQPEALKPAATAAQLPVDHLSAEARLNALLRGTVTGRLGQRINGSPEQCAKSIVNYLLQEGLIVEKELSFPCSGTKAKVFGSYS